jgi:ketosteroid isomerase-like protein
MAEDAVVEAPFARPGMPRRIEGRAAFQAFAEPRRAAFPVRFTGFHDVVVHETADPEVIVAEYELAGTVTTTGRSAAAAFVLVLRVREGKIVHMREYQNVLAIADALGEPVDSYGEVTPAR